MRKLPTFLVAGLFLVLSGLNAAALAQSGCVSPGEGQQMVAQGKVAPLPAALQRAGLAGVEVVAAELCHSGGGWAYHVRYRQGGQVSSANVPAG
jgi:hypothetical protein